MIRCAADLRFALLGRETGYGDPKYPDHSEDRISVGNYLLGRLIRQRRHGAFQSHYSIGEKIANFSVFAAAFIPAIFAYSGWNAVIYIAGEVKEPERNLPRALLWANLIVIALYLAVNVVYIYAVPVTEMKGALRVSEVATTALFGHQTSAWITAIITVSILGALNVVTMIGPRVYYAMARDGLFFKRLTRVHPSVRHADQCDHSPQATMGKFAYSNRDLRRSVYLCERHHHAILRAHSRFRYSAPMEEAGAQATLQALGLSNRSNFIHPGSCCGSFGVLVVAKSQGLP